jgi:hypothetical protein
LAIQPHVFEEAGLVQRSDSISRAALVDGVAAFDGQVGKYRAGGNTLQAIDADIADRECVRQRCQFGLRAVILTIGRCTSQREGIGRLRQRRSRRGRKRRGKGEDKQAAGRGSRHYYVQVGFWALARAMLRSQGKARQVSAGVEGYRCRTPDPSDRPTAPSLYIARRPSHLRSTDCP